MKYSSLKTWILSSSFFTLFSFWFSHIKLHTIIWNVCRYIIVISHLHALENILWKLPNKFQIKISTWSRWAVTNTKDMGCFKIMWSFICENQNEKRVKNEEDKIQVFRLESLNLYFIQDNHVYYLKMHRTM